MKRVTSLVVLGLMLASTPCWAQEDAPEPQRYPPSSVRAKIILGGLGLFALSYGTGFLVSELIPEQPGIAKLRYPVVGPWIGIPENKSVQYGSQGLPPEPVRRGLIYGVAGLAQIGGLALVTEALIMKTQAPAPKPDAAFIMPVPIVSPTMVGLTFTGRF